MLNKIKEYIQIIKVFLEPYWNIFWSYYSKMFDFFIIEPRHMIWILLALFVIYDFWKFNIIFKIINFSIVRLWIYYFYFFRNIDFQQVYRDDEVIFKNLKRVYFSSPLICREKDIHDLFYILEAQHKKINWFKTNLFVVSNRYQDFRFSGFIVWFDDMKWWVTSYSTFFYQVYSRQKKFDVSAKKFLDLIHDRFDGAKDDL